MIKLEEMHDDAFIKIDVIIGNKTKGIPPLIPMCRASWYAGIRKSVYPKPIKLLGSNARSSVWRVGDVKKLLKDMAGTQTEQQPR